MDKLIPWTNYYKVKYLETLHNILQEVSLTEQEPEKVIKNIERIVKSAISNFERDDFAIADVQYDGKNFDYLVTKMTKHLTVIVDSLKEVAIIRNEIQLQSDMCVDFIKNTPEEKNNEMVEKQNV